MAMDTVTCILTDNPDYTPAEPGVISVYAPAVLEIAGQFHVDLASLPFGGLNDMTERALRQLAPNPGRGSYCAVFALDPLTNWARFAETIRNAGFTRVCSYPDLPEYGPEEQTSLAASSFSDDRERDVMLDLCQRGFQTAVFRRSLDIGERLIEAMYDGNNRPLLVHGSPVPI